MAWTGLTSAAIWHAAIRGWRPRPIMLLVMTYLVAVSLYAAWDSVGGVTGYAVLAAIGLTLLTWTTHRLGGHRREHAAGAVTVPG